MKKKIGLLVVTLLWLGSVTAQEDVTIAWWHVNTNPDERDYWEQVAEDYMAAHPNIHIEITVLDSPDFRNQLMSATQGDGPPDLFHTWGGNMLWRLVDAGLVRDIAPQLNASRGAWKNSFSAQSVLELYEREGEYYGVPWNYAPVGIYFNKALFARAGLDPEAPPATWTDLLAAVEALKAAGITPIAVGEQDKWPGHYWAAYLALRVGGAGGFLEAYDRDAFEQAYALLADLVDREPFQPSYLEMSYSNAAAMVGRGEVAMELMGAWAPAAYEFFGDGSLGNELGWFMFPAVQGGAGDPQAVFGGGDGFALGSEAPDETIDFLKYITSPDVQAGAAEMWVIPVVEEAETVLADDPIKRQLVEARNTAPFFLPYLDQYFPPALGEAVNDVTQLVFAGEVTPQEAAAVLEEVAALELVGVQ